MKLKSLNKKQLSNLNKEEGMSFSVEKFSPSIPERGRAIVSKVSQAGYFLKKEVNGSIVEFNAAAASDVFLVLEENDEVLYENIEGEFYILNVLKFSKDRQMCEISFPMNAGIRCPEGFGIAANNISCRSQIMQIIAKHVTQDAQNYELKAERTEINSKLLEENAQTVVQRANIFKSDISGICDVHHANTSMKVDNTCAVSAEYVKLDANGHVDIDGKKINLG